MFSCLVKKDGSVLSVSTYRGTPDSKLLEQEILKKLSAAANPKFIPAIYNHMPVGAIYYGTVTFAIVNDKPRLRIFSNQERAELAKESDFIGPQPFWGGDSKFSGFHYDQVLQAIEEHRAFAVVVLDELLDHLRERADR